MVIKYLMLLLIVAAISGCESMGDKDSGLVTVQDIVETNKRMADEYCGIYSGKVSIAFTEKETESRTSIDCSE
ncbi:MAG: hypothetical protein KTR16_11540 [Acidiferrobacterales bacterium]|nr:hypothetical protein [Acidiferrobacterales bacterium]